MAVSPIFPVVLIVTFAKCYGQSIPGYNYVNGATQFGDLLKPPPPPLPIAPVPFHGGKPQRQTMNRDSGYHYQTVTTTSITPVHPSSDFKFPSPFYKQYNFNFVPAPQPFATTPSPSIFQKFSGWLFPSAQTSTGVQKLKIEPFKKDCNPCNLVPWIPVIKYNLGAKNGEQGQNPTYGPPSPTALAQNVLQYHPQQPILNQNQKPKHIAYDSSPVTYGRQEQFPQAVIFENPSSTYGPPSVTQQTSFTSHNPSSSPYTLPSSSNGLLDSSITQLSNSYGLPASSYSVSTSTYRPSSYVTPVVPVDISYQVSTISPHVLSYTAEVVSDHSTVETDSNTLNIVTPAGNLQLPKVTHPIGFKNSYGEDITNSHLLDIPYSLTSLGAESSKIKTQVAPHNIFKSYEPNISVALANPAPFTLNKGRNIHTLQPVALPNLSVSPLPPIFNARPFRPIVSTTYPTSLIHGINYMQKSSNNVNVEKSVPIAEFVHSVEYPTTIIQSPIIDIDATKTNHNKAYRDILNSYTTDEAHDISPQASEDHISAAKVNQDVSFETTGADFSNNLYDPNLPTDIRNNVYVPPNHRPEFADLRGIKDEDVDRYRTESNLQSIDSPLLYLKPSAPHKNFESFVLSSSIPESQKEYEIYDEVSTTPVPTQPTSTPNSWNVSNAFDKDSLSSSYGRENRPKVVQIIVPYIKEQNEKGKNKELRSVSHEEHQGRKVPFNTEIAYFYNDTETSTNPSTTTEYLSTVTENYDSALMNSPMDLRDLYDVKEPPFDIIKLQHTIDDWTEQEYSNHYTTPDRTRTNEKYAKQIPEDYFTTINPNIQQSTEANDYNYDHFDHEGSSSVQHSVTDIKNSSLSKSFNEYNMIDRSKSEHLFEKGQEDPDENQKLRIYTAASSFRSTTTTPAPWGSIQTSISPLTKEKVYVVTSKPWRDKADTTTEFKYALDKFTKKTDSSNDAEKIADDFLFSSPRFSSRPPFGFTSSGPVSLDSIKSDSSYGFSKGWHQSINNLRSLYQSDSTLLSEGPEERIY